MTTVVVYKDGDKVWMGADGRVTMTWNKFKLKSPKMFERNGMLIGVTGTCRTQPIMEHAFVFPEMTDNFDQWLHKDFSIALNKFRHEHTLVTLDMQKDDEEWNLLLATRGRFFFGFSDCSFIEIRDPFMSVGSGRDFAYGAYYALKDYEISARDLVKHCLRAAGNYDNNTGPPYAIRSI